jgi:Kef-type K+ transport system membrane component KefB
MEIFIELSIVIIIATLVSVVMKLFKQPLVVGYILSGIIAGPYVLGVLQSVEQIEIFSKIGISILLFIVGLALSPKIIREVGKVSLITGLGQVVFTSIIGFFICLYLGFGVVESLLIAIAITFSSTIIVLKLLSDRGDSNKLYGRVATGFLLVQDVVATIVLLIVSTLGSEVAVGSSVIMTLLFTFLKGLVMTLVLFYVGKRILPRLSPFFASSQEFLFLFALAWGFGMSTLFYLIGFSIEIGALIAGIALSLSPFSYEISSKMKPLRDFFILLFFILLGGSLTVSDVSQLAISSIVLSFFILIGNPLIVYLLMSAEGFKSRTSFQAGLTVAQISEFSLILMTMALSLGLVSKEAMSLVTVVGLITIAGSTYLIMYSDGIFSSLAPLLKKIELRRGRGIREKDNEESFEIVLFGFGRVGLDFVDLFKNLKSQFLVVDFNPERMSVLEEEKIPHRFGDAEDVEFLDTLNLKKTKLIVSTIPDFETNALILGHAKAENPEIIFVVVANDLGTARALYDVKATYVITPHHLGAEHAGNVIRESMFDLNSYQKLGEAHLLKITL